MSTGVEEIEAKLDAGGMQGMQNFRYALRKFRKDCENFAIPTKFRYAHFFAMIAKFRYHSEIRYPSENYCA